MYYSFFIRFTQAFPHFFRTVLMSVNVIIRGKYVVLVHTERIIPSKSAFRLTSRRACYWHGLVYMYMHDLFNKKRERKSKEKRRSCD